MRIGGIGGPEIGPVARRATDDRSETEAAQTRALVAIAPVSRSERLHPVTRHPTAPFLAQLIATQMLAPQTRARRRAEPGEAIAVYAATLASRPVVSRRPFGKQA
jgi:hypothetical protein